MFSAATATIASEDPVNLAESSVPILLEPVPAPTLRVERIASTTTPAIASDYLVTIDQPAADNATLPVLFIDVLDISGSMGCPASDNTSYEAAAFSRADLVRHSVATQIELLRPQDRLAVVLFDHNSEVALPPTQDRAAARAILPRISANGGTNIWGGLFKALSIAEEQIAASKTTNQNVVILLQTDGQSDPSYNPPRGIVPTLRAWMDAHPTVRLTIHTIGYGMGDDLDTPLLRAIADATHGTSNYIPDGSMVGTVFIHLMANLMSIVHNDLILQIPEVGLTQYVGPIQSDQVRELVLSLPELSPTTPFTAVLRSPTEILTTLTVPAAATLPVVPPGFPSAVSATLRALRLATTTATPISAMPPPPITDLQPTIEALLHTDPSHRMMSLLTDLSDPAPDRGQIAKAFASAAAYRRWGRHYIPTVISSLQNGWAINFKDTLSTEVFGTPLTHELVARGDAIFTAIPPPVPTNNFGNGVTTSASRPLSMASVHSSAGPCFLPGSLVRMVDGTEKRCDQIRPGDRDVAGYTIQCVIKTLVPFADIVRLSGPQPIPDDAGFTLWHPVINPATGEWTHPATMGTVERVATDAIYNFVLKEEFNHEMDVMERPGMLIVNGLQTCTMGHNFRANAVIDHPYFGAVRPGHRHILDDLQQQPGWTHGYVTWSNLQVTHDPATGMICGMTPMLAV
jgi:Mg-chelatase subunit ChlD